MFGAYGRRGEAVAVPRWVLGLRALQFIFAVLVLGLTAYALSVFSGGPMKPALIATIIIAVLTIVPILLLTTPLHIAQRKMYDPRIALLLDMFAMLYWLAAFAVLASYVHIYRDYGRGFRDFNFVFSGCKGCRSSWRTSVAATVFAAIEFLLFLASTLAFIKYYHHHLAGTTTGTHHRGVDKTSTASAGTTEAGRTSGTTGLTSGHHGAGGNHGLTSGHHGAGENHHMESIPHGHQSATTGTILPHQSTVTTENKTGTGMGMGTHHETSTSGLGSETHHHSSTTTGLGGDHAPRAHPGGLGGAALGGNPAPHGVGPSTGTNNTSHHPNPPYPTNDSRTGGYENGSNNGYGADNRV